MDIEIVKAFAPYAAVISGLITFYIGRRFDIKNREKKEADRDNEQDKRFDAIEKVISNIEITNSRIENDVKELAQIHKYERLSKEINAQVKNAVNSTIVAYNCQNEELQQMLYNAATRLKSVISDILETDFSDVKAKNTIQRLKIESNHIGVSVNYEKFEVVNIKQFREELTEFTNRMFVDFAQNLEYLAVNFENGRRREKFKELVLTMVNRISSETIIMYEKNTKKAL